MKNDRLEGPWEFGEPWTVKSGKQGTRSDLQVVVDYLKAGHGPMEAAREFPAQWVRNGRHFKAWLQDAGYYAPKRDRTPIPELEIYYGPTGCGKSRSMRSLEPAYGGHWWAKPKTDWFDGYSGHPVAIFDEWRNQMTRDLFLEVTDRYEVSVPVKGGFVNFNPEVIRFGTNFHPRQWYDWDTDGSGEQFAAIKRRFHRVWHWRRGSGQLSDGRPRPGELIIITPEQPELWELWWRGPTPGQVRNLGPLDDWVEHGQPGDQYDFIPSQPEYGWE